MAVITIAAAKFPNWRGPARPVILLAPDRPFVVNGEEVQGGPDGGPWRIEVSCTVTQEEDARGATVPTLNVPEIRLLSTTDSDDPTVKYKQQVVYAPKKSSAEYALLGLKSFRLPATPTSTTWAAIRAYNLAAQALTPADNLATYVNGAVSAHAATVASAEDLGHVRVGEGLVIDDEGVLSVGDLDSTFATDTQLTAEAVLRGQGDADTLSAAHAYTDDSLASFDLSLYQARSEKNQANGYAGLDGDGLLPDARLPASIARDSEVAAAVGVEAARATNAETSLASSVSAVSSAVTALDADLDAEVARAQAAEALLAPLASPAFTGAPTVPTPLTSDVSTRIASTAFVDARVTSLINSAPAALDTLGEIAAQLSSDESAVSALTTTVAGKLAKASNLSDLTDASAARTNLGLGTLATQSGTFSGTSSGVNTGDQTSVPGNAGTATTLQTARNIDGQSFNGSADITVIAPGTHAAASKATPVDADEIPLADSAASFALKKLPLGNWKATLKTYFDTLYQAVLAYVPFNVAGDTLTGTGGSGFAGFPSQSSGPSTPASGFKLYADANGKFSWKGSNGFVRTFDGTANTADRAYVLPDAGTTIAGKDVDNAFSVAQTFAAPLKGANGAVGAPTYSFTNSTNTGMYQAGGSLRFSSAGSLGAIVDANGIYGARVGVGLNGDLFLQNDAANTLGQKNGNNDQYWRTYGANGGYWERGTASELITLSTSGTTTDSTANLLPANAVIEAVVARITTTITTATDWKLGDPTTPGRFTAANSALTAGTTDVGTLHVDQTGAAGQRQPSAAKVRITTTGTPGAGAIRVIVFYRRFVPPTS